MEEKILMPGDEEEEKKPEEERKREKELKKRKEKEKKKSEEGEKVSAITCVGVGGCGNKILEQLLRKKNRGRIDIDVDYYFYDLSKHVKEVTKEGVEKGWIEGGKIITPIKVGAGAARTPMVSKYIADKLKNKYLERFASKKANIYFFGQGGGTGGGASPAIVSNLEEQETGSHILFSVLSSEGFMEEVNQLYNFSEINEKAGIVILVENEALRDNEYIRDEYKNRIIEDLDMPKYRAETEHVIVNEYIIRIVELLDAISRPDTYQADVDPRDIITHFGGGDNYEKGIRFCIPYIWPVNEDYERDFGRKIDGLIINMIEHGCLCKGTDIEDSELAFLIAEGPFDYLVNGGKYSKMKELVAGMLGIREDYVKVVCVPNEEKLRLCLLLYPPKFGKTEELKAIPDDEIQKAKNAWITGLRGLKEAKRAIVEVSRGSDSPIEEKEITEDIKEIRNEIEKLNVKNMFSIVK